MGVRASISSSNELTKETPETELPAVMKLTARQRKVLNRARVNSRDPRLIRVNKQGFGFTLYHVFIHYDFRHIFQ